MSTVETVDTRAVWAAVHAITEPTKRKVQRDDQADEDTEAWLAGLAGDYTVPWARVQQLTRATSNTVAIIPPLWHQAVAAIIASESGDGSGGSTPLRERSVGDLDLLETVAMIRETVAADLGKAQRRRPTGDVPEQMKAYTRLVATQPEPAEFWRLRCLQWARLLRTHLNQVDGPRPVHLRNSECPECGARQHVVTIDRERRVVPALLVDFRDDKVRAAWCQACGRTWWRDQLQQLAAVIRQAV